MKNLILSLLIFITACSCTKETGNPDSFISFQVGDSVTLFKSAIGMYKETSPAGKVYYLNGSKSGAQIGVIFNTDSLMQTVYHFPGVNIVTGSFIITSGGITYGAYAGNEITVTITSYANGLVSGNFTGRLAEISIDPPRGVKSITVTGAFKNVPVFYF